MNNLKTGTASEASEEHLIRKYLPSVNLLTKGSTLAEFTSGSEEKKSHYLEPKMNSVSFKDWLRFLATESTQHHCDD